MKSPGEFRRSMTAPFLVLVIFLLLITVRFVDTSLMTRENEYVATIVLELMIFLLPAAAYLKITGRELSQIRLRFFGLGHLLLVIAAVIALACGTLLIEYTAVGYGVLENNYDLYGIFISKKDGTVGNAMYLTLAYALLPAVCEEFVFRGVLCSEYERRSGTASVIMPALFFAMIHFDVTLFPAYFFAGVVMGLTYYSTQSVFAAMVVHGCHNLLSVFGRPYIQTVYDLGGEKLFLFLVTAAFLLFAFIFCAEAARLYKIYSWRNSSPAYREMDPPYGAGSDGTALEEIAARFPRLAATLESLMAPPALLCYLVYTLAVVF